MFSQTAVLWYSPQHAADWMKEENGRWTKQKTHRAQDCFFVLTVRLCRNWRSWIGFVQWLGSLFHRWAGLKDERPTQPAQQQTINDHMILSVRVQLQYSWGVLHLPSLWFHPVWQWCSRTSAGLLWTGCEPGVRWSSCSTLSWILPASPHHWSSFATCRKRVHVDKSVNSLFKCFRQHHQLTGRGPLWFWSCGQPQRSCSSSLTSDTSHGSSQRIFLLWWPEGGGMKFQFISTDLLILSTQKDQNKIKLL